MNILRGILGMSSFDDADGIRRKDSLLNHLKVFDSNVYIASGSSRTFLSTIPCPTRMAVVVLKKRSNNKNALWIWNPIPLTPELVTEVDSLGVVQHIVVPNSSCSGSVLMEWQERYPTATVYVPSGFDVPQSQPDGAVKTLENEPDESYSEDLDQLVFDKVLNEVVFFHKPTRTVLFADLVQRIEPERFQKDTSSSATAVLRKLQLWMLSSDGLVGPNGGTPQHVRFAYWCNGYLPEARHRFNYIVNEWEPNRLLVAHGQNASEDVIPILAKSFDWIPNEPTEDACGCIPLGGAGKPQDGDDGDFTETEGGDYEDETEEQTEREDEEDETEATE